MASISIVKNAGPGPASMLFAGVYGSFQDDPQAPVESAQPGQEEQAVPRGKFSAAPEFMRVSHLFRYIESGAVPVAASTVKTVQVPDELADAFKANLLQELGARWNGMYDSMLGRHVDTMTQAMLSGERQQVLTGVRDLLLDKGAQVYEATFQVPAESRWDSGGYETRESLLADMVLLDDEPRQLLSVSPLGTDLLGKAEPPAPEPESLLEAPLLDGGLPDGERGQEDPPVMPEWVFQGHHVRATLTATIHVVATSPEQAEQLAQFILNEKSMRESPLSQTLAAKPVSVDGFVQGRPFVDPDDELLEDDEDDEEMERGDRPRL